MEDILSAIEARVLGVLVEKELTTPEYYPLSLNALVNGCNQKSNREPVMSLAEEDVVEAIRTLRIKHLAWERHNVGARVIKYEHNLNVLFELNEPQVALMCVLLLHGPQTTGEIRLRSGRMHTFETLNDVALVITELSSHKDGPLVMELPKMPGRKENRYMHCMCSLPDFSADPTVVDPVPRTPPNERIDRLEEEVLLLKEEVVQLKAMYNDLKKSQVN